MYMNKKHSNCLLSVVTFAAIWLVLYFKGRHMLYLQEQLQLFQMSSHYILSLISRPGGLARVLTEAVVQFYHVPFVGVTVVSLIAIGAVCAFRRCISRLAPDNRFDILPAVAPIIPLLYSLVACEDTFPLISFAVSILISTAILRNPGKYTWLIVMAVAPLLYYAAGASAMILPFMTAVLLFARPSDKMQKVYAILPLIVYVIYGFVMVRLDVAGPAKAFFAYQYPLYERHSGDLNVFAMSSWGLVLVSTVVSAVFGKSEDKAWVVAPAGAVIAVIASVWIIFCPSRKYAENLEYPHYSKWAKLYHLYAEANYDDLLGLYEENAPESSVESNFINLALYRKGRLAADFLKYSPKWQHYSLRTNWLDMQFPFPFIWVEVCEEMGALAKAHQSAFEGNVMAGPYGSAPLTLKLAEYEMIRGNYESASRYLDCLDNTLFYKEKARKIRLFLSDDAVEADPYYSAMRACFYDEERTLFDMNDLWLLIEIAKNSPDYKPAFEYAGVMVLSAGEMDTFVDMVIKLTAAGAIKVPMAPMLQEAMTMAFSSKPEILDMYKVDKKHLSDYKEFVAAVSGSKSNSMQANSVISKNRNRYWYYHYSMTNARNNRPNPVK